MLPRTLVVAFAFVVAAGCLETPVHRCDEDTDCASGVCAIAAGDQTGLCIGDPGSDGGTRAYDPCLIQEPLAVQDSCTTVVCDALPRCCTHEWSELCRQEAERSCDARCGELAAFGGDDDLWVGRWNGDDFAPIWAADIPGEVVGAVAWGDLDGDLRPELATCGGDVAGGNVARIYHNEGDDLVEEVEINTVRECGDLDWIDIDGDDDLDLTYGSFAGPFWIRNDDGLWSQPIDFLTVGIAFGFDWADLGGDGRLDVVVARYDASMLVLEHGAGETFTEIHSVPMGSFHWESPTWGDVTGDGVLDLLASGDGMLRVLSPGLSTTTLFEATFPHDAASSLLLDIDEDGDLDVVSLALEFPMRAFRNNLVGGAPGFTQTPLWSSDPTATDTPPFVDPIHGWLVSGDADGDGHVDLVACAVPRYCRMWLGDGDGGFAAEWAPGGDRAISAVALTGSWPGARAAPSSRLAR